MIVDDKSLCTECGACWGVCPKDNVLISENEHGKRDITYGHYRRYEKEELIEKLVNADLHVHTLWSYGVNTISRIYRKIIDKDLNENDSASKVNSTGKSAIESDGFQKIKRMYPFYSKLMFLYKVQLLLLNTNNFRANYGGLFQKK